jgi:hypothetical protein
MENAVDPPEKCPNCGRSEFENGWVHPRGVTTYLIYSRMDEGGLLGFSGRNVTSRRCLGCGRLEFFAR